jgi:hypothetical protein
MHVIAGIEFGTQSARAGRIAYGSVKVDDRVVRLAGPNPSVHFLTNPLAGVGMRIAFRAIGAGDRDAVARSMIAESFRSDHPWSPRQCGTGNGRQ